MPRLAQDQPPRAVRTQARHRRSRNRARIRPWRRAAPAAPSAAAVAAISTRVLAQPRRELAQNAMHLAQLFFAQPDQFVVEVDGFERLDEQRVAAAAGAVNHAIHAPLAARDHGHHEAVVADGDEIFLQRAVFVMRAQEALERFLDQMALLLAHRAAGAPARRWHGRPAMPSGRILPRRSSARFAQIGDRRRRARARRGNRSRAASRIDARFAPPGPAAAPVRKSPSLRASRLRCAGARRRAGIGDLVEADADRRAARGRLRLRRRAQIFDRLRPHRPAPLRSPRDPKPARLRPAPRAPARCAHSGASSARSASNSRTFSACIAITALSITSSVPSVSR